jgi:hypothetical protein
VGAVLATPDRLKVVRQSSVLSAKPSRRRSATEEPTSIFILDREGIAVLLLFILAGAKLKVLSSTGRGRKAFHYLCLALPSRPSIAVHRLIADTPSDRHANVPNHNDLRRCALGPSESISDERARVGKALVKSDDSVTRPSAIQWALWELEDCPLGLVLSESLFRGYLEDAFRRLSELPLMA